jgi:hypothetical protein
MRSMRQRLAAVTLLGGLTTLGIGFVAGPASAASIEATCNSYLGAAQSGSLHVTSTPAAGSTVNAGSSISLNPTWDKHDFDETDKLFVCGSVAGVFNSAVSTLSSAVANDGSATAAAAVPADTPAGSAVCVVTALSGRLADQTQGQMVSEKLCYTAAAAATTTTSAPTTTTTVTAPAPVEPTNTEAGTPSAPAVEAAPAVQAAPDTPAPAAQLPRTGSGVDVLAGFGAIALATGSVIRFLGRRRPAEA